MFASSIFIALPTIEITLFLALFLALRSNIDKFPLLFIFAERKNQIKKLSKDIEIDSANYFAFAKLKLNIYIVIIKYKELGNA